ncbi:MAG: hypothetical protein AB7O59_24120 [Pirellulales bacterium]
MGPTFKTDRLLVYKISLEHDPASRFDQYVAYERTANDHPYRHVVDCSTARGENCVLWIQTRARERAGLALELLNGIAAHERYSEPLYPNYTISGTADALFAKHEQCFKSQSASAR